MWECNRCTYVNTTDDSECSICGYSERRRLLEEQEKAFQEAKQEDLLRIDTKKQREISEEQNKIQEKLVIDGLKSTAKYWKEEYRKKTNKIRYRDLIRTTSAIGLSVREFLVQIEALIAIEHLTNKHYIPIPAFEIKTCNKIVWSQATPYKERKELYSKPATDIFKEGTLLNIKPIDKE